MMNPSDSRYLDFSSSPDPDNYKGFYLKEPIKRSRETGQYSLTFTNDEKELTASGQTTEEAYSNIFDMIDNYIDQ